MRRLTRPPIPDHGHTDAQVLWAALRAAVDMLDRLESRGALDPAWSRKMILIRLHLPDFVRTARVMLEDFDHCRISERDERAIREKWRAAWDAFIAEFPEEAARNSVWLAEERAEDLRRVAQELGVTVEEARELVRHATDRLKT